MCILLFQVFANPVKVLAVFKQLAELDAGVDVLVNGKPVRMLAFALAYIGDMPQQAWNAGFLGPRARLGCRSCYIDANEDGRGEDFAPEWIVYVTTDIHANDI